MLIGAIIFCALIYIRRQRAGTLKPEARVILLVTMSIIGLSLILAALSSIPDLIQPPVVEKGRVMRVYSQIIDPESGTVTRVALSNGADLIVPDPLGAKLLINSCVEMTHTPTTQNLLSARQLAPDACLATK